MPRPESLHETQQNSEESEHANKDHATPSLSQSAGDLSV
jgi:hypothetical protein